MIAAAASLGMAMFSGWLGRKQQRIQNIVYDAEAQASNTVREGKNLESAAQAGLANWMISENNNRRLNSAGQQRAAGVQTLMRQREAVVGDSIESQLADAEQAGAYAANVALSGASGGSVDIIDMAMQLKQARSTVYRNRQTGYMDYDTQQQIVGIIPQTVQGLDVSTAAAPIDYSTTYTRGKQPQGNWLLDATTWAVANPQGAQQIASGAASFFTPSTVVSSSGSSSLSFTGQGLKAPSTGLTFGSTKVRI